MENTNVMAGVVETMQKQVAVLKTKIDGIQVERDAAIKKFDDQLAAVAAEGKSLVGALAAFGHVVTLPGLEAPGTGRKMTQEARAKISAALKASAERKKAEKVAAGAPSAPETAKIPVAGTIGGPSPKSLRKAAAK